MKRFFHKAWLWIRTHSAALGAAAGAMFAGVLYVLFRTRPRPPVYNDPLELKQKELREAEALGAAKEDVERIQREIDEIEERRTATTDKQLGRVARIESATSWDELDAVRDAQNAEAAALSEKKGPP